MIECDYNVFPTSIDNSKPKLIECLRNSEEKLSKLALRCSTKALKITRRSQLLWGMFRNLTETCHFYYILYSTQVPRVMGQAILKESVQTRVKL